MYRRRNLTISLGLLALAFASAGAAGDTFRARVTLGPPVVGLGQQADIVVSNVHVPSLQVLLAGATDEVGKPVGWRSLRPVGGSWRGSLPRLALLGVYPVVLRVRSGATPFGSSGWLLRVFAPGTRSKPSFDDPAGVARWWVENVAGQSLVALREWPFPDFDRRDPRLHRLYVVAYAPENDSNPDDRLGMFVTAVRDGFRGRWRLLEATLEP